MKQPFTTTSFLAGTIIKPVRFIAAIFLLLLSINRAAGQTTLASWASSGSHTPTTASSGNISMMLNNSQGSYNATATCGGPFYASSWTTGAYWQCDVATTGYSNITISSFSAKGSNTGPRDFKIQYSTNGTTWTDLSGATYALTASCATPGSYTLPAACNGIADVGIRFVVTDAISVNGGTLASGGTSYMGGLTITGTAAPTAAVALSNVNPAAGSVLPATTNVLLQTYSMSVTTAATTLSGLKITTAGTYSLAADVTNIKCWYSNSSTFSTGTATVVSTYTTTGTAGAVTFPAFTSSPVIASGTSGYIHITADIASGATAGKTIGLAANTPLTNVNLGTATLSGTLATSNTQTVVAASGCTGTPNAGTVSVTTPNICGSGTTNVSLTGGTVATGITYQWSSSSTNTPPGTNITGATSSAYTPTLTATGSSVVYYYWCTTRCTASSLSNISSAGSVTVNPTPVVTVTPTSGTVCSGTSGLTMTASGANTYTWVPATSLSATSGASVVTTASVTTSYTVTGTASTGCVAATRTVSVNYLLSPSAVTLSSAAISECPGATPQLLTASGGTVGPTTTSSGTINLTLSGSGLTTETSTIPVTGIPAGATITGAYITLNASFTGYQDAYIFNLAAPNGKTINLVQGDGCATSSCTSAYTSTIISSSGTSKVNTGATPFTATYSADAAPSAIPSGAYVQNTTLFSDLYGGTGPNGNWTLAVYHNYSGSDPNGLLASWSVTITYSYQSITWAPATNLYKNTTGTTYTGAVTDTVYAGLVASPSVNIYTVTAANGACTAIKTATVTVNAAPAISGTFSISPASVCPNDVPVTLAFTGTVSGTGDGSFVGYNWTGPGGYSATGTSVSAVFTPTTSTESGNYSVSVTYADPGCTSTQVVSTNSLTISSPLPHSVTGGYGCTTPGIVIGLDGTETGVNYQLYNGGTAIGSPVPGTGSAISFNSGTALTDAGTYTVTADNGSCAQSMTGSAVIYSTLNTYSITGTSGCTSPGVVIGLNGSDAGVSYQLYNGSSPVSSPVSGTGTAISFNGGSAVTTAGTYSVGAAVGSCSADMSGKSIIYSSLNTYAVTGGNGCTNPGIAVALTGSDYGVAYQLCRNSVATGSPVTGTGAAISFGTQTVTGNYIVQASIGSGCTASMTGTDVIYNSALAASPATTAICAAPGQALSVTGTLTELTEAFDGTIGNDGWTSDATAVAWGQTTSNTFSWSSNSLTSGASGKFYLLDDRTSTTTSSHLISPSFSLVGAAAASFSYNYFFDKNSTETAGVDISTNGGTSWTNLWSAANSWTATGSYNMSSNTISLNTYTGNANVKLRFSYDRLASAGTTYLFAVDNASVTITPAASSYSWAPAIGLSAAIGSTVTATPTVTTTYTLSVIGCVAGTSFVRVDALPTAGTINASPATICTTGSFILSESGTPTGPAGATIASYSWTGPNSYVHTGTGTSVASAVLAPTTTAATGNYSLTVTYSEPGCTSTPVQSASVTVSPQPSLTFTATPSVICTGGTLAISTTSTNGAGTPTYSWRGPGIATVTGSALAPASFTPTAAVAPGNYTVTATYPTGLGCSTASGTQTVTVAAQPTVSLSVSPTPLCAGNTATFTAAYTGGNGTPAYTWSGPGITGATATGATAAYSIAPPGTATDVYTVSVSFSDASCNTTANTATITPTLNNQWQGTTSTDWNATNNWTCGAVPTASNDVIIPAIASYTFAPAIPTGTFSIHSLSLSAGTSLTLGSGATLSMGGDLVNNGTIAGDGVIYLNGAAPLLSGNGSVSNMTLDNTAGATIGNSGDTVGITGTLLLNAGTLTTNDRLMLISGASGNGNIGTITGGSISGNVTVQQYIPGGRRAYRFWAHPFNGSISLAQIQNCIDITGIGGSTNGFTTTASNAPSAYWYNTVNGNSTSGSDPGWTTFTNTFGTPDANMIHQYEGIRLFMRGSKGEGLTGATYVADPATIRMYGVVNTGSQTVTLTKGADITADYNLIGNPYPAVTDIGTVIANAAGSGSVTGAAFYIWNPYLATSGQFVSVPIGDPYYIGANESFEVRTAADGNVIVFDETNKGNALSAALLRSKATEYTTLSIYDTAEHLWDRLQISFNDVATDNEDAKYDAAKPPSPAALNFYSLSADSTRLSLDARPFRVGNVIPLGITSSYAQPFIIKADNLAVPAGGSIYLHDKFLQKYVLLQQGTEYKFTISKDAATRGQRFELRMSPSAAATARVSTGITVQISPNPASSELTLFYSAPEKGQTNLRITDASGTVVLTRDLGIQQDGTVHIPVTSLASGLYIVTLTSGKEKTEERFIKN